MRRRSTTRAAPNPTGRRWIFHHVRWPSAGDSVRRQRTRGCDCQPTSCGISTSCERRAATSLPVGDMRPRRQLDVPGCQSENLSVEAVDGQLVITGERQPKEGATRRYRSERSTGRFVRSFTLQPNVRGDDVRADYHDGVLSVHVPKPEETKPKRISITRERKQITKTT